MRVKRALTFGMATAVSPDVKVLLRTAEPYESTSANPLGSDRPPHRMWSWADGSWLLMKFLDDGATLVTTSPGLVATVEEAGARLVVHVDRGHAHREAHRESV